MSIQLKVCFGYYNESMVVRRACGVCDIREYCETKSKNTAENLRMDTISELISLYLKLCEDYKYNEKKTIFLREVRNHYYNKEIAVIDFDTLKIILNGMASETIRAIQGELILQGVYFG